MVVCPSVVIQLPSPVRERAKDKGLAMRVKKLFDTLQICLNQRFMSLSGYGIAPSRCAFAGCTLSHWSERQGETIPEEGAGGKVAVWANSATAD